jgi:hypothetical protein
MVIHIILGFVMSRKDESLYMGKNARRACKSL